MIEAAPVENPAGYKFICTDPLGYKFSCTDRGSTGFYMPCALLYGSPPQLLNLLGWAGAHNLLAWGCPAQANKLKASSVN